MPRKAPGIMLDPVTEVSEKQGEGLRGKVAGREVWITGRSKVADRNLSLPAAATGLECVVFIDGTYAAIIRFRDVARAGGRSFVNHLRPRHHVNRVLLVSGDRESEVRYLADVVGIKDIYAEQESGRKSLHRSRGNQTGQNAICGRRHQ